MCVFIDPPPPVSARQSWRAHSSRTQSTCCAVLMSAVILIQLSSLVNFKQTSQDVQDAGKYSSVTQSCPGGFQSKSVHLDQYIPLRLIPARVFFSSLPFAFSRGEVKDLPQKESLPVFSARFGAVS